MVHRALEVVIISFFISTSCHCQTLIYYCSFNMGLTGDCNFRGISGASSLFTTAGIDSGASNSIQPLSDVTAVQSLTYPENEPCEFPYNYPLDNWPMHFCRRYSDTNYTCPIESGIGHCVVGKYVYLRSTGGFDHTYLIDIQTKSETVHCLHFYYYLTNTANNTAISFGWESNAVKETIVEVLAQTENKWRQSKTTYTSPSSGIYQIWLRMRRTGGNTAVFHALDEIKIFEGSCDFTPPANILQTTTVIIATSQTNPVPFDSTTQTTDVEKMISTTKTTLTIKTAVSSIIDNLQSTISAEIIDETTSPSIPIGTTTRSIEISSSPITTTRSIDTTAPVILTSTITMTIPEPDATSVFITSTSTITSQLEPIIPLFTCDFSTDSCFGGSEIVITNGTEFTIVGNNEPPASDVTSIIKPTNNNETCQVSYLLSTNNSADSTSLDMWFCYKNQCPTQNGQLANCTLGYYGLISIGPRESNKTITRSISRKIIMRDSVGEQCLLYYYYFTVYNQVDWSQQISVFAQPDNQTENEFEIDRLTVAEMTENRWYSRNVSFNSTFANYTLVFHFEVTHVNGAENSALNRTIYFALDNIELYDYSCSYVIESSTISTTTKYPEGATHNPSRIPDNFGLILGLLLGLGIPMLLIIITGVFLYSRKIKRSHFDLDNEYDMNIPMTSADGTSDSDDQPYRNIF